MIPAPLPPRCTWCLQRGTHAAACLALRGPERRVGERRRAVDPAELAYHPDAADPAEERAA